MSWKILKQALKNKDMRKKILYVLFAMFIFRILAHIPIPLDEPQQLRQLLDNLFNTQQLLGFLDSLSGGALSNFSIVLLGLGPYINASIIFQLLTKAIPKLETISKDGEAGRRKINQYTRYLTFPLAILNSIGILFLIRQQAAGVSGLESFTQNTSFMQWAVMVAALTGGSMLLMWIGELMSEQGVGNGISLLIFAGIAATLPSTVALLYNTLVPGAAELSVLGWFSLPISGDGLVFVSILVAVALIVTLLVVKLNEAQRIITVSYAKRVRGNRAYGGVDTVLPIKLITAGVIPIIFAVAFLSVPGFVGQLLANAESVNLQNIGNNLVEIFNVNGISGSSGGGAGVFSGQAKDYIYPATYFALVMMFTYFYTGIMFNSKEIAENLQKQGGFIPGIRPGKQTEQYLGKIVNRLTLFGSIALGLLAIMPFLLDVVMFQIYGTTLSSTLTIGGTSLLITVAVAIETLRQVESKALMVTYDSD